MRRQPEVNFKLLPSVETPTSQTKRPISDGAEKWLRVPIKCLDHGFVQLVDYQGSDVSIEEAARVSYGGGTRKSSETEGLIRYLRRHDHTTPFEMASVKFHAKLPIFVARQWVRHRTASINELSGRYSILSEEFYIPDAENLAVQSTDNRQGRGQLLKPQDAELTRVYLTEQATTQYDAYEWLLNDDGKGKPVNPDRPMVARELARMPLGTNLYTEWYWQVNLHNFMHFERLRLDPHAQHEIRVYAQAMEHIGKEAFPIAWKAFENYELYAQKFTESELKILTALLGSKRVQFTPEEITAGAADAGLTNRRETQEVIDKFRDLGIVSS
ncbi:hypothetical protein A2872_01935 [Candidatus Gottesmanbacteria bacterium RIFCSPHIGHO2_01_FULL_42_12]|uniref:Flavin-dependent thymidylate synthase n=1 Tax=Candidatus Gottesmanbacteria bacterium RIFCSPHIGHO2_01_FULL_42_12 TaxID=1798377 RepID=A0A1F5Z5I3_9BACT|nr:MAG: hypothetical protein A2872_01935 [Candidatus Gottesmanbacteria bacterium RIFCSPHIGHO2_01_FULL_42_12]